MPIEPGTPSTQDHPHLSIVVPAYNEEERLPLTLNKITTYLSQQDYAWEVIVVNDGSEDQTAAVVTELASNGLILLNQEHRGKACAVTAGVLAARGDIIFMCDADLSVPIEHVGRFLPFFASGYDIVIGSREAQGARRFGEPGYRHMMGRVFNWAVWTLTVSGFHDTQCGFKAFRKLIAQDLFHRLQLYNGRSSAIRGPMVTGFDVELLFLATKRGYRIAEVPVDWHYGQGSKVRPFHDTIRMLGDVLRVRWNEWRARYS
ncbi:MAG: glycosyltransferase family 2 protein [Chloroflexi bacterium]|nr:glycosyltransferase family 2 protein [Chloroflexota bacterium]